MMPGFSHILHGALNTIYCDIVQTGANRKKKTWKLSQPTCYGKVAIAENQANTQAARAA